MSDRLQCSLPEALTQVDPAASAFFFDFDGTLAPIVSRPADAAMPQTVRASLERLMTASGAAVAVLSGRALGDLEALVAPLPVALSGSHGLERRHPGGAHEVLGCLAEDHRPALDRLRRYARRHGLLLEEKPGGASLHFRNRPALEDDARALGAHIVTADPSLRLLQGHMVVEIALAGRDKGAALADFMAEAPFAGRRPVAVGDDVTDEDAFREALARSGLAVKIGPGESCAPLRLPDIGVFHAWLASF